MKRLLKQEKLDKIKMMMISQMRKRKEQRNKNLNKKRLKKNL